MPNHPAKKIMVLSATSAAVLALSLLLPTLIGAQTGLAAAASAALLFIVLYGVAGGAAIYSLAVAIRHHRGLGLLLWCLAIAPVLLVTATIVVIALRL